jgi:hypothetical protein
MRRIVVGVWLLFCALTVSAEEPPASAKLFDGGFAPGGANFRVTFGFSDMVVVSKSLAGGRTLAAPGVAESAFAWSSAEGAPALGAGCRARRIGEGRVPRRDAL